MVHSQSQGGVQKYNVAGEILWVPLLDIYVDLDFNCRGRFTPQEVYALGQSIKEDGQLEPLVIQPIGDVPEDERPDPCAWPFRLVAGHRRYVAIDVWTSDAQAQCKVVSGLSRQQAHALNIVENLQRKDLNMLEEAQALQHTWPDYEVKDIAKMIAMPKRWVKSRLDLLYLPEYVQRKAALKKGGLSQYDIEHLAKLPPEQIESVFQELIATKGTSRKPAGVRGYRWKDKPRGKEEIKRMIGLLYESQGWVGMSDEDRNLVASTLSWVMKGIKSQEFLENRLDYPRESVIVDKNDKVTGFRDDEGNEMK
jgi:ParB family chromosome partitioning protein